MGDGTETSDSNLAYISHRESILKAKATKKYKDELTAANNLNLEDYIYKNYTLPALKQQGQSMAEGMAKGMLLSGLDDGTIARKVDRGTSQSKKNTRDIVQAIDRLASHKDYMKSRGFYA